jgi:SAM-dependent methyltransferase
MNHATDKNLANQYLEVNKALWESRLDPHLNSGFYAMEAFKSGASSLNEIELALLGDLRGKSIIHLQCHFGQDSLSLSRMGARVTGVDFSPRAIDTARSLASELTLTAQFICSDVHDAATVIREPADMVFTTYGVLGWLPDIKRWASVVSECLKPGGELLLVEFHPVIWMFDNDFIKPTYSYFNSQPIIEQEEGTYADPSAPISLPSVGWNHSLGEVYNALSDAGMQVSHFDEYNYSPYPAFSGSVEVSPRRYGIKGYEGLLPLVYSLRAVKKQKEQSA